MAQPKPLRCEACNKKADELFTKWNSAANKYDIFLCPKCYEKQYGERFEEVQNETDK